jgi:hypothetical protein
MLAANSRPFRPLMGGKVGENDEDELANFRAIRQR